MGCSPFWIIIIGYLLESGADPNINCGYKNEPFLHSLITGGDENEDLIELFLTSEGPKTTDPNILDNYGKSSGK